MSISVKKIKPGIIEIKLETNLIEINIEEFKKDLSELEIQDNSTVIINFKEIKFISSSGIAAIGVLYNLIKKQKGKLILVGLNSGIKSLFKILKFTDEIRIYKTLDEALKKC